MTTPDLTPCPHGAPRAYCLACLVAAVPRAAPDGAADLTTALASVAALHAALGAGRTQRYLGQVIAHLVALDAAHRDLADTAGALVAALPPCSSLGCGRPATHAYARGAGRWCPAHAPVDCPPYPRAAPLARLTKLLGT